MSTNGGPLLRLDAVDTFYGPIHILQDVNIEVREGELVCLLGGNASGKSTTLKTILGIIRPRTGRVLLGGEDVTRRPTSYRIARGIAIVPENRRLFAPMTVQEILEMGAYLRGELGLTVLLIEHDMRVVMGISDRVTVLDYGEVIAEGAPAEVRANPRVVEAYLGTKATETK